MDGEGATESERERETERRKRSEGPKFFGRPTAAATAEGPEIWTFAL